MKIKNILNTKNAILMLLAGSLAFTGCKKLLDVNDDPNYPNTATPNLLLPTVQASVGQIVGNSFQIYGNIWAQFWTQRPGTSQYRTFDQYNVKGTTFDRSWLILYRNALQNAQLIITNTTSNSDQTKAIAYIMKAYTYQIATDAFGDVPLTDALQADSIGSPHYDKQAVVYDSIFNFVDKGMALAKNDGLSPGEQDMIFQGDMSKWVAFGNTLKLKAYLRLAKVDAAKASAGIAALYAAHATFLNEDAEINYTTTGGNQNPLYNEMVGLGSTQNLGASSTAVLAFKKNNDPRAFQFYALTAGVTDSIAYIAQGTSNLSANAKKVVSTPSALVGGDVLNSASAVAAVKLISASESSFLQAEAVARGWASGNVASLFKQGIQASFAAAGIAGQASNYIASAPDAKLPASVEGMVEAIITQKYYAMCGTQGFEAWTEYRRTGYPGFINPSASSVLADGATPLRFLYPNSEATTNSNYPGTVPLTQAVWWDVN